MSNIKSCFCIFSTSSVSAEAQQGEALLWSSWLEKHPEPELLSADVPATVIAPWEDPHMKADWDKHAADTYYSYWEQYSYWAAQGWTPDQSICLSGEAATGVMDGDTEKHLEKRKDRQGEAESQRGEEEAKAPHRDAEVLCNVFGQSCILEASGDSVADSQIQTQSEGELCGSDEPTDGGNERKRPGTSSQQNTAQHAGKTVCVCVCAYTSLLHHVDKYQGLRVVGFRLS